MKKFILILCATLICILANAQTATYVAGMKPFIGEWKCEQGSVEMTLIFQKVSKTTVKVKYKAVNYEDGRPKSFYSSWDKMEYKNGKILLTKTETVNGRKLRYVETATIKNDELTLYYQSYEYTGSGYELKCENTIGVFHNW